MRVEWREGVVALSNGVDGRSKQTVAVSFLTVWSSMQDNTFVAVCNGKEGPGHGYEAPWV